MDQAFNNLLTNRCEIRRAVLSSRDVWGAGMGSIETISASEPCLFQQMYEDIEISKKGKKIYSRHVVFFNPSTNIIEDDLLVFKNKKYNAVSVEDAASQEHHLEVWLEVLEN